MNWMGAVSLFLAGGKRGAGILYKGVSWRGWQGGGFFFKMDCAIDLLDKKLACCVGEVINTAVGFHVLFGRLVSYLHSFTFPFPIRSFSPFLLETKIFLSDVYTQFFSLAFFL